MEALGILLPENELADPVEVLRQQRPALDALVGDGTARGRERLVAGREQSRRGAATVLGRPVVRLVSEHGPSPPDKRSVCADGLVEGDVVRHDCLGQVTAT